MKTFNNILCMVAAEEPYRPTLERAVSLAQNNQAQLTVVNVIPPIAAHIPDVGPLSIDVQAAMITEQRRALEAFTAPYRQQYPIQLDVLTGTVFLEIIHTVLHNQHDLVIKLAEDPHFMERLFGSDDMHLLRKCPCPVWLTKPGEKSNYDCILAAVDFDLDQHDTENQQLNQQILELSSSLALSDFAELHVVHVWEAFGEMIVRTWGNNPSIDSIKYVEGERSRHQSSLNQLREQLRKQIGIEAYDYLTPHFHLQRGAAVTVIPELARQLPTDLVIMGTVARTGIAGLFIGNTAEAILEQLRCSVLTIKPRGFISPVKLA